MAEIEAVLWLSVTDKDPIDEYEIAYIVRGAKYRGIEWDELKKSDE